jgi:hypothetical protein
VCFWKKSMACVNIVQWYSSISSFKVFIVCLINAKLYLFIFAFTRDHDAHSFVLSIFLFHYVLHVMISSNYLKGFSKVGWSLRYSKGVFIISHILFSMIEIKVYSIIVSKVFGVTIVIKKKIHCKIDV